MGLWITLGGVGASLAFAAIAVLIAGTKPPRTPGTPGRSN
jgi:hypothetical protein